MKGLKLTLAIAATAITLGCGRDVTAPDTTTQTTIDEPHALGTDWVIDEMTGEWIQLN